MRSQDSKKSSVIDQISIDSDDDYTEAKGTGVRSKFNVSMERRIERLWFESKSKGWNFNGFVLRVFEVLVVLHHRSKDLSGAAFPEGALRELRSQSPSGQTWTLPAGLPAGRKKRVETSTLT